MQELLILKGPPGAGKSTFAREWCQQDPKRIRINKDDLREMNGGWKTKSKFVALTYRYMAKAALKEGYSVVMDSINSSFDTQTFTEMFPGLVVVEKLIYPGLMECVKQDAQREAKVGPRVICYWAGLMGLLQKEFDISVDKVDGGWLIEGEVYSMRRLDALTAWALKRINATDSDSNEAGDSEE